jgi:hypothetical protein
MSFTKFLFFYADQKFKMAATAGHRLTLDPMGKGSNAFFSETTNMIKAKLYMNVHWSSLVSEKKIFEISANQSILLALPAMLNIRLERKRETL